MMYGENRTEIMIARGLPSVVRNRKELFHLKKKKKELIVRNYAQRNTVYV